MGYSYQPKPKRTQPPLQTVHVYVVDEDEVQQQLSQRPDWGTRVVTILAMLMLMIFCLVPYQPVFAVSFVTVPAHFLPSRIFTVGEQITPTGTQTTPATAAHGTLIFYNGSLFGQLVPQGFQVTTNNGTTVVTDQAVTIPASNPPTEGIATVTAHALNPGASGNIQSEAISQNYGNDILIQNRAAFTGGQDAITTSVITADDVAHALAAARSELDLKRPMTLLAQPCDENQSREAEQLTVTWSCIYATYIPPAGSVVLNAFVQGKSVILQVKTLIDASGG